MKEDEYNATGHMIEMAEKFWLKGAPLFIFACWICLFLLILAGR